MKQGKNTIDQLQRILTIPYDLKVILRLWQFHLMTYPDSLIRIIVITFTVLMFPVAESLSSIYFMM